MFAESMSQETARNATSWLIIIGIGIAWFVAWYRRNFK